MPTGKAGFIHRSELDKVCFQSDMVSGKSKYLTKITQSGKVFDR